MIPVFVETAMQLNLGQLSTKGDKLHKCNGLITALDLHLLT